MHVISRKKLRDFCKKHADCCEVLDDWYRTVSKAKWGNLVELQAIYPQAEAVAHILHHSQQDQKNR